MPFKKGQPRPANSGRKRGSLNRATVSANEIANSLGCNPLEILCMFAVGDWQGLGYESDVIAPELRLKAAQQACEYIFPKRKAIDHNVRPTMRHEVISYDEKTLEIFTNEPTSLELGDSLSLPK